MKNILCKKNFSFDDIGKSCINMVEIIQCDKLIVKNITNAVFTLNNFSTFMQILDPLFQIHPNQKIKRKKYSSYIV